MSDERAIVARGLTRRFGELVAVDHVDLDVARAKIYGFLGPNGSGKSTTIRMLCGLLTPSDGSARVLGLDIPRQAESLKSRIGYMTQKFSLYGDMSARENLAFIAAIYSLKRRDRAPRIEAALKQYDLVDLHKQRAATMSGGQKQRLALAAATLHRPQLLFLDEPTSAVDPKSRRDFWASLFELAANDTTILVSTHYMEEAERCHHLAILDNGAKVTDGTPRDLARGTGMNIVEIEASSPNRARRLLEEIQQIFSITQLGQRLRVLIPVSVDEPLALVQSALANAGFDAQQRLVTPNLEDVFVTATEDRQVA